MKCNCPEPPSQIQKQTFFLIELFRQDNQNCQKVSGFCIFLRPLLVCLYSSERCSPVSKTSTSGKKMYSKNVWPLCDKTLRIKELGITRTPSCIHLNPPPRFVSSDSRVYAARNRAPYQVAVSSFNYMKVSQLNRKDDLLSLVTISSSKII